MEAAARRSEIRLPGRDFRWESVPAGRAGGRPGSCAHASALLHAEPGIGQRSAELGFSRGAKVEMVRKIPVRELEGRPGNGRHVPGGQEPFESISLALSPWCKVETLPGGVLRYVEQR
jgi:hypothetical protein